MRYENIVCITICGSTRSWYTRHLECLELLQILVLPGLENLRRVIGRGGPRTRACSRSRAVQRQRSR